MYKNKKIGLIIAAAGLGTRLGGNVPKLFLRAGDKQIITTTVEACAACGFFDCIYIVTHPDYMVECMDAVPPSAMVIPGGKERQDSVFCGLEAMTLDYPDMEYVLIHDGARPYVSEKVIKNILETVLKTDAAVVAVPVKDTIKRLSPKGVVTLNRSELYAAQTPQAFRTSLIFQAHKLAQQDGFLGTDDGQLVERMGTAVALSEGDYGNVKITTPEDLPRGYRVGTGYDVHPLVEGRPLILAGLSIPFEKGLLGHSDADVLTHAIMDALLGAAGLGDIGQQFPDSDPAYKGISSMSLLKEVVVLIENEGYAIGNVDATLIAQRPKIAGYKETMIRNLAEAMGCLPKNVSIKATTTEKLGIVGKEEGMAAEAICILTKRLV